MERSNSNYRRLSKLRSASYKTNDLESSIHAVRTKHTSHLNVIILGNKLLVLLSVNIRVRRTQIATLNKKLIFAPNKGKGFFCNRVTSKV